MGTWSFAIWTQCRRTNTHACTSTSLGSGARPLPSISSTTIFTPLLDAENLTCYLRLSLGTVLTCTSSFGVGMDEVIGISFRGFNHSPTLVTDLAKRQQGSKGHDLIADKVTSQVRDRGLHHRRRNGRLPGLCAACSTDGVGTGDGLRRSNLGPKVKPRCVGLERSS